jgi:hypothetical protein
MSLEMLRLSKMFLYIMIFLIVTLFVSAKVEDIMTFFGYETKANIELKLTEEKNKNDVLEKVIENERDSKTILVENNKAEKTIQKDLDLTIDKNISIKETTKTKLKDKVKVVTDDTKLSEEDKVKEVSLIRIATIWDSYEQVLESDKNV